MNIGNKTKLNLKIAAGITALGLIGVGIKYSPPLDPNKIEEYYPDPYLYRQFGGIEKELEIDVIGDGIKDHVKVFHYGHAFYADGKIPTDEFLGRKYHRIHAGTKEDRILQQEYPVWLIGSQ